MNVTRLTIGFVPIARQTFDTALAAQEAETARQLFAAEGYRIVGPEKLVTSIDEAGAAARELAGQPLDLLLIFQATFADSTMLLRLVEAVDAPLLLWAIPEKREQGQLAAGGRLRLNSLCGINLGAHALRRAGYDYDYLYAPSNAVAAIDKAHVLAEAGHVQRRLRATRIGRVGEHPDGFETCIPHAEQLKQRFGAEVVQVELDEVFEQARATGPLEVEAAAQILRGQVEGLDAVDQDALRGTLSTYVTLDKIAGERELHGLAVRCWPEFFTELGCAACGAMSMLSDGMTPCSCEVDVNGTLTQFILQMLSEEPAFGTDIVDFDLIEDRVVVWHCGLAPVSMADPGVRPRATIHSNRALPLLMEFPLKPGRVTVARLSEATGEYRLVIGGGQMLKAPVSFAGTSGVMRFDRPAKDVLDTLIYEGLEHHIALTYGDHIPALEALAKLLDIPVLCL